MGLSRFRDCTFSSCSSNLTCCNEYKSTAYYVSSYSTYGYNYSYSYYGYNKLCDYSSQCLAKSSAYNYSYDYNYSPSTGAHVVWYFSWIPLVILSIICRVCIISSRRRAFNAQQTQEVVTTTTTNATTTNLTTTTITCTSFRSRSCDSNIRFSPLPCPPPHRLLPRPTPPPMLSTR